MEAIFAEDVEGWVLWVGSVDEFGAVEVEGCEVEDEVGEFIDAGDVGVGA